jgi:DNA-binding NarL/FixJ family response regulator
MGPLAHTIRATNETLYASLWIRGQYAGQSFRIELLTGGGCLGKSTFRVLVVDDYEPWRSFALRTLQKKPELQVVSEASDGLEAVQKAQELQPDLILLDIGLPTLNGIEAARQILEHAPNTKILFVSEQRSSDIAGEALRTGAGGYLVKSKAATELFPAVEAVLQGKPFVSASLTSSTREGHENQHIGPLRQQVDHHEIKFHADHAALAVDFAQFTEAALNNGNAVIIIATKSIRSSIFQRLRTDGVDLDATAERYFPLDISEPLSRFMVDDAEKAARQEGLNVAVG